VRQRLLALGCVLLAVGGVAVAAVVADEDEDDVVVAAEAGAPTTFELSTTTTDLTVPTTVALPVTVPEVTLPRLRTRTPVAAAPTAAVPTTTTVAPVPKAQAGSRCGTPWGYAGLGAEGTATAGRLTVTLQVYSCELYDGEQLQAFVNTDDKGSQVRSTRVEYGDGTSYDAPYPTWYCTQPEPPNPQVQSTGRHDYPTAGAYEVTATVTTASCDGWETGPPAYVEQSATVRMIVYRIAGKRPG
jgi:hypothetical protein